MMLLIEPITIILQTDKCFRTDETELCNTLRLTSLQSAKLFHRKPRYLENEMEGVVHAT